MKDDAKLGICGSDQEAVAYALGGVHYEQLTWQF